MTSWIKCRLIFCSVLIFLMLGSSALWAQGKSEPGLTKRLNDVCEKLASIQVEDMSPAVPPEARGLISTFKRELVLYIQAVLNDPTVPSLEAAAKRAADAIGRLTDSSAKPKLHPYGSASIVFDTQAVDRGLLIVKTVVNLNCGADTSMYILRKDDSRWRVLFREESPTYKLEDMARDECAYVLTSPNADGIFLIVTAWYPSWCTSAWRSLHYSIYRAGLSGSSPEMIIHGTDSLYIGFDEEQFVKIEATADAVSLSYYSSNGNFNGTNDPMRKKTLTYSIDQGKARLVKKDAN